nr:NAD(P)-dependent oxidoreductase [Nocardioides sp. HDW12B]
MLGTGIMGAAMARSLAREGHEVVAWNRTPEKARDLGKGITAATSVLGAVTGADAVVTMLFDADSVVAVAPEVAEALGPEAVWVQASTVGPDGMKRIASAAGSVSDRLLDAPVLGTRKPAEDGALVLLVSGPAAARETAGPVFGAVGSRVVTVADEVGPASALKLACNSWVATINAATAQAMALAEGQGVDPALFLEAIKGGPVDTPYAQLKGGLMQSRDWDTPAFAVDGVRKDVGLMLDAAETAHVPPALLTALLGLYDDASARGHGGADMAAVRSAFDA